MPLYLTERDVAAVLDEDAALAAVAGSLERTARGEVEDGGRGRIGVEGGYFGVMHAVDRGLGLAGLKAYTWLPGGAPFVVVLFSLERAELDAVVEADLLGRRRTAAASAFAARLVRPAARTLGVFGCGRQAEGHVAALRAALPLEQVVVHGRDRARVEAFCERLGCIPAGADEAAAQEVVVTATTAREPVLRGELLRPGAVVLAIGANEPEARELDDVVLERAALVCTDSREEGRREAGDLIAAVGRGALGWADVRELHDLRPGSAADDEIVVFKSNGIAPWDVAAAAAAVAAARARGIGREL